MHEHQEKYLQNVVKKLIIVPMEIEVTMERLAEATLHSVFLRPDEGVEHHPNSHVHVIVPVIQGKAPISYQIIYVPRRISH
jgi:hypothetical protein